MEYVSNAYRCERLQGWRKEGYLDNEHTLSSGDQKQRHLLHPNAMAIPMAGKGAPRQIGALEKQAEDSGIIRKSYQIEREYAPPP